MFKRKYLDTHWFFVVLGAVLVTASTFIAWPGLAQDQILQLKVKLGEKAPDFALPSADGKTVRLSDFAGRSVLIDFYRGYW